MNRISIFQKVVFFIVFGLFVTGCAAPKPLPTATLVPTDMALPTATVLPTVTPTPLPFNPPAEGRIIYQKPDGRKFAGKIYGQGKTAIILGNMVGSGEDQWNPFIEVADKQKFTLVTYLRLLGDDAGIAEEANIVLQRLREAGYQRVICIGASLGVNACGSIAGAPEMIGAVLIGGPNAHHDTGRMVNTEVLEKTTYPKLFTAGELDPTVAATKSMYEQASEPKSMVLFPGESRHATELFYSSTNKDAFIKLLVDFINKLS